MNEEPKTGSRRRRSLCMLCSVLIISFTFFAVEQKQLNPFLSQVSSTSAVNRNSTKPSQPLPTRVARICWHGVANDLEVDSKLAYLLQPLQDAGYIIHIYLRLQTDEDPVFPPLRNPYSFHEKDHYNKSVYITAPLDERTKLMYRSPLKFTNSQKQSAQTANDVASMVRRIQNNTSAQIDYQLDPPLHNPPVPIGYLEALASDDSFFKERDKINREAFPRVVWRTVNDIRGLESLSQCGRWLQSTNHTRDNNDLIFRVGDDCLLENPIDVPDLVSSLSNDRILTIPCRTRRGHLHDQMEIYKGLRKTASYFRLSYAAVYQNSFFTHSPNCTLASLLQHTLKSTGFSQPLAFRSDLERWEPVALPASDNASPALDERPVLYPLSKAPYLESQTSQDDPSHSNNGNNKTALVCITGQVQRLELANKMERLLQPLQSEGGYEKIDLVLVLSEGKAVFQKKRKKTSPDNSELPTFATAQDVLRVLRQDYASWVPDAQVKIYQPDPNLPVNPQYLILKGLGWGFDGQTWSISGDKFRSTVGRVLANTKMLQAYQQCLPDTPTKYDLHLRVRDDVGFAKVLHPQDYLETTDFLLTSSVRTNGGMNDRMAILKTASMNAPWCFFSLPFVELFAGTILDKAMQNTEALLARTYWKAGSCLPPRIVSSYLDPRKMLRDKFLD